MRMRQSDDLAAIGWIGEDFLIPGDGGIENHFTGGKTDRPDRRAPKNGTVG
jgi:hypothetical protein